MQALEIACDESGYEGEKLIDTTTDVFAHAGVRLSVETAAGCLAELRRRVRSPATEYKAGHLLREKHRAVLVWLLGPSSPVYRNAHVFLIDKVYFVLGKLTDLLLGQPVEAGLSADRRARAASEVLYRDGTSHEFLVAANTMMRGRDRRDVDGPVSAFFRIAGGLAGRERATAFRVRMKDDPVLSLLDPLIPALVRAVTRWGGDGHAVTVVHDRQTMLPGERVDRLRHLLHRSGVVLTDVRLAPAEYEPRVQLADILAGTVRKIAQDELHGHGDPELTTLIRPYLDAHSIWGDRRSWALMHA
ncbi:hypothetical protein [Actinoplanes sp. N902-109]|uniref:hypothetical protein n=1 Tax=Actinoplanes sp. (strain N902-109) TaxID=649831 RepID=UPI0005A126ED|nr:hypothetical protein [Actinoplanes sp. N902-109]